MKTLSKPTPLPLFISIVFAAALAGIIDALLAQIASAIPVKSFLLSLCATVGLYSMAGAFIGVAALLLRLFLDKIVARFFGSDHMWSLMQHTLKHPEHDRTLGAALLTLAGLVALCCLLVFGVMKFYTYTDAITHAPNQMRLTALAIGPIIVFASILFFPAYQLLHFCTRLLPKPRTISVLVLLTVIKVGLFVFLLSLVQWRHISFAPWIRIGVFFLATLLVLPLFQWIKNKNSLGPLTMMIIAVLSVNFATSGLLVGTNATAYQHLQEQVLGGRILLQFSNKLLRKIPFFDHDKDGFTTFMGNDCNDFNPQVYPKALDIPKDGIDQNCDGVDATEAFLFNAQPRLDRVVKKQSSHLKKNWLIITIDTLRADHIDEKLTPNLFQLAKEGVSLTETYAQAPNTPRSFPSFLASIYPSQIPFVYPTHRFSPVKNTPDARFVTLFTALHDAGYKTFGYFSHLYLDKKYNLYDGFDEFHSIGSKTNMPDTNSDVASPRISKEVISRLQQLGTKTPPEGFVLWTHLFEPHGTYIHHPEFADRAHKKSSSHDAYDEEVAFTDHYVGEILKALNEAHLDENTGVVVFADHGEALGDLRHSMYGAGTKKYEYHGEVLYGEVLRVPWIMKIPGLQTPKKVISERRMLIDLAPTILELSGVSIPRSFQGRSIVPLLEGTEVNQETIFSQILPNSEFKYQESMLITPTGWKIYSRPTSIELYNLNSDWLESENLAKLPEFAKQASDLANQLKYFEATLAQEK